MVAPLRRVLVCDPGAAGWNDGRLARWRALGYRHEPDAKEAARQHSALRRLLSMAGAEIVRLPADPSLSLDAVYAHDASLITDAGLLPLAMGKASRGDEPGCHRRLATSLDLPLLAALEPPSRVEAGDLVWLGQTTLLAGRGYRTNAAGLQQLQARLEPLGVAVIASPLPHGRGPAECLHLMSLISLLDERTALVDRAWLAVPTLELLAERGYRLIDIAADERGTLACNVLALGAGRLIAFEENVRTNAELAAAGFQVDVFPGSQIGINGSGGPTCLTRPLCRSVSS
jgi:N-dimethylarginine dimethylaminohydrolase